MNEMHQHNCNEPDKHLLRFLTRTINMFNEYGWGQPGSITAAFPTRDFKHHINEDIFDPIDFIDSYEAEEDTFGLILHWEYWPPVEVIEDRSDADVIRALLYCDKWGHKIALITGRNTDRLVFAPDEFGEELNHMSIALHSQRGSGCKRCAGF